MTTQQIFPPRPHAHHAPRRRWSSRSRSWPTSPPATASPGPQPRSLRQVLPQTQTRTPRRTPILTARPTRAPPEKWRGLRGTVPDDPRPPSSDPGGAESEDDPAWVALPASPETPTPWLPPDSPTVKTLVSQRWDPCFLMFVLDLCLQVSY